MASVRRVKKDSGTIVYQAVWREGGRQVTKNFMKKTAARAHANQMALDVERRGVGDPERLTVSQFLANWMRHLEAQVGEDAYSPTTLNGYQRCIDIADREIGKILLSRLTARLLDDAYVRFYRHGGRVQNKPDVTRPLKAGSVLNVHRCLHTAFEQARRWGLIPVNPAQDAKAPSPGKRPAVPYTSEQVQRLLTLASKNEETYALAATALHGLRRGELAGLAEDCVDLGGATITIRRTVVEGKDEQIIVRERAKTQSSLRTIKISPELVAILRRRVLAVHELALKWGSDYRRKPMFLFPGLRGEPIRPHTLTRRMNALQRRAGIKGPAPVHGWRHTAGTSLFHATKNVKTVQTHLGHSTSVITMNLYVHPVEEGQDEAAQHFGALLRQ